MSDSRQSDAERKARLAEQLRANLRRRKAQARALRAPDSSAGDAAPGPDPDADGPQ